MNEPRQPASPGRHRPRLVAYDVATPLWTASAMRIAVLADIHAVSPWTPPRLIRAAVARIMALAPDLILLPGDFIAERILPGRRLSAEAVATLLTPLSAPLGVYAALGNHDWKDDGLARSNGYIATAVTGALERAGIPVLVNAARPLGATGAWLVGLDSQRGHLKFGQGGARDDPEAAFGPVPARAPTVLMAHEPDYFRAGPRRGTLQISGHTHGGQISLLGWRPMAPVQRGRDLAYGHLAEGGRHVVVSGGLGYSGLPVRVNQPPEITLIRIAPA